MTRFVGLLLDLADFAIELTRSLLVDPTFILRPPCSATQRPFLNTTSIRYDFVFVAMCCLHVPAPTIGAAESRYPVPPDIARKSGPPPGRGRSNTGGAPNRRQRVVLFGELESFELLPGESRSSSVRNPTSNDRARRHGRARSQYDT